VDDVTVYQNSANQTTWARIGFTLGGKVLTPDTRLSIELVIRNAQGLPINILELDAAPPFNMDIWDWFQYLHFLWDRTYRNFTQSKVQQLPTDFRMDFRPRLNGHGLVVAAVSWSPVWTDDPADLENTFVLIDDIVNTPQQWTGDDLPLFSLRVTQNEDQRVTQNGSVREANYSPEAAEAIANATRVQLNG